jgi:endonuclease/exonuclease/phosphatase family metal-dependent hydrolase
MTLELRSIAMRIATFNVRYGTADDGPNSWSLRRDILFETIQSLDADVLCVQECLPFQGDEIIQHFPHLSKYGLGRYNGVELQRTQEAYSGEHCDIIVDPRAYSVERCGTFWHSDTPDVPGSVTWDNNVARITTWAILRPTGKEQRIAVFNTHLNTKNEETEYATNVVTLTIEMMRDIAGDLPRVLVGDFNSTPGSYIHRRFTGHDASCAGLVDHWFANGRDKQELGTCHDFSGIPKGHIDWILTTPDLKSVSIETIRDHRVGRYPSDHFPVVAELQFPETE